MTPEEFRSQFPGTAPGVYLDVAARGLISAATRQAADGYLEQRMLGRTVKEELFATVERCRLLAAALIGARPAEIAFTQNVSEGLNAVANAIDWRPGDNVVLCSSVEHPANLYPWLNLARRSGIEMRTVAARDGVAPLDEMLALADARTRVMTAASVSFAPGFRFPVARMGAECRRRGILSMVDGAQSVGVLRSDVVADQVDVLAASGQKGLLAPYGIGFVYIRAELADRLAPVYLSRMGIDDLSGHEASSGNPDGWGYAPGARRFEVGNFNYIGAAALERSLGDLLAIGPARVEDHALSLARRLSQGLEQLGCPVFRPPGPEAQSHIVAVGREISDSHDSTEDGGLARLFDHLRANGVTLTIRRGMLRFSCHAYNDAGDIDRVLDLVAGFLDARS